MYRLILEFGDNLPTRIFGGDFEELKDAEKAKSNVEKTTHYKGTIFQLPTEEGNPKPMNALTTQQNQNGQGQALTVYQQFKDPLEAVDKLGQWFHQSGMAKNPGEGSVMALACLYQNEDPFKFKRENMIMMGNPTRKYQMLLVDLRQAGGDYKWLEDGEDSKQATIEITWKGQSHKYTFTMEMAKRAGLVKPDSNWEKWPGNMLRSKCVRQVLDMHCPEVSAGYITPEDAEDIASDRKNSPPPVNQTVEPTPRQNTAAQEAPPFEIEGEATIENTKTETEQKVNGNGKVTRERLQVLVGKAKQLGLDGPTIKQHLCDSAEVSDPSEMTADQCEEMIIKVDAKLSERLTAAAGN